MKRFCCSCNTALGLLKEDLIILNKVIAYLNEHVIITIQGDNI